MKLIEMRAAYDRFAGKASDVSRQLGFAGLALVWVLSLQGKAGTGIPTDLVFPTGLIVSSLAVDLLQYLYAALVWGVYHRIKERLGTREDEEFLVTPKINWPTNTLFWLKQVIVVVAYYQLLQYLFSQPSGR